MPVHNIKSREEYESTVIKGDKPVLLNFFQTSSEESKESATTFIKYSEEFTHVLFVKIDIEKHADIAEELGVKEAPMFILFNDGKRMGDVVGDPGFADLTNLISKNT